ncbi:hypothetical protein CXB51_003399 [Gossypium anomalum]|uniref:RNase H type-1 domain-containing protein n=1 Tax=Gossypium anomalum TaxID=47600 RepID=A0A8J6D7E1_9ROSI|nr:hypothetical protein CXB51_003399 [Gossypium anomalum]
MSFHDLCKFNIALSAKQGWRLVTNPNLLVPRIYSAKYFPNTNFWNVNLGSYPSYVWKSIYAARKLLEDGIGWRLGSDTQISVWRDRWLPRWAGGQIQQTRVNGNMERVADLIDHSSKSWRILCPERLSNSNQQPDYSGRRTWEQRNLQKKLWQLQIPPKIKIANRQILHNCIPKAYILYNKRIAASSICPRYGGEPETSMHVITRCGPAKEHGSNYTCKVIAITVWAIWHARNKQVMEGKQQTAQDITIRVASLVRESDEINQKLLDQREKPPQDPNVKANFDAAGAVKNDYISNSFSTGAIACIPALKFAEEMRFRQIEVEGDSQTIIVKINQDVVDRSNMVV